MNKSFIHAVLLVLLSVLPSAASAAEATEVQEAYGISVPADAAGVREVFGLTVGAAFNLPDCATTDLTEACTHDESTMLDSTDTYILPVRVPAADLPANVDPASVVLTAKGGVITSVKYSAYWRTSDDQERLHTGLATKYKGYDSYLYNEIARPATADVAANYEAKAQWVYQDVVVSATINKDLLTPDNFVRVEVAAK